MNVVAGPASGRIDLHAHILPGVDDGARDPEEALAMLRLAASDGTRVIAATPHSGRATAPQVTEGVAKLNALAQIQGLDISVVTGCEVRFDADLPQRVARGEIMTLNGTRYLLMELSLRAEWSPYLARAVYDLQLAELWPILAHAERYPAVQRDPTRVIELVETGVLIQVNADALSGYAGRGAQRTAEALLARRLVHVIASDAHDLDARPPVLSEAFRRAETLVDASYARMLRETPQHILDGVAFTPPAPLEPERSSWLGRLRSRRD